MTIVTTHYPPKRAPRKTRKQSEEAELHQAGERAQELWHELVRRAAGKDAGEN